MRGIPEPLEIFICGTIFGAAIVLLFIFLF